MIRVSVIIPAYNGDRYISAAIDSVLAQTYGKYEIIVVDDGSTDNTSEVIKQYGDRVNYLSQSNQGVAASRNLGLAAARGEYIAFLDQDDVFLPHKLSTQVALLDRDSALGIVNSGWQIVDERGETQSCGTAVATNSPPHSGKFTDLETCLFRSNAVPPNLARAF